MDRTNVTIIGGGPGGLAPLLAAHRHGRLGDLLQQGVALVEQSSSVGDGSLGRWCINSDSTGFTFADCLAGPPYSELASLRDHAITREFAEAGEGTVPLQRAGEFLRIVGEALTDVIATAPKGRVLRGYTAVSTQRVDNGWLTRLRDGKTGHERTLLSRNVVLATGASQPAARLRSEVVAGVNLFERYGQKLLQSGDVLSKHGLATVSERLSRLGHAPRVAIIGGSTSAAAVAHALLHRLPEISFGPAGVCLLHRRELRIYYPSVDAAVTDGYTEFGPKDICPLTGRVFRLAGFRLDSRELIMRARGIGGRLPEPRLHLHRLGEDHAASLKLLDEADLVIAAFGYRPHALPVLDETGARIPLFSETGPQARLIDNHCRVMDADGHPLPRLFAIGLAAGFVPHGKLGGEQSFRGQANGLWLWQSEVGGLIVDAVLAGTTHEPQAVASPAVAEAAGMPMLQEMEA